MPTFPISSNSLSCATDVRLDATDAGSRTVRKINPRSDIDEEQFAGMYRTCTFSNRALAAKFQISESFVRKLAKRLELTKDLSKQVRDKVQDNLVRASVRGGGKTSDTAIVADAAELGTVTVLGHRRSLAKLRRTADMLSEQLEFAATNRAELEAVLLAETESGAKAAAQYRDNQTLYPARPLSARRWPLRQAPAVSPSARGSGNRHSSTWRR